MMNHSLFTCLIVELFISFLLIPLLFNQLVTHPLFSLSLSLSSSCSVSGRYEPLDPATLSEIYSSSDSNDRLQYKRLYIMTLGVLAAYRNHSIGSNLLHQLLEDMKQYPAIVEIYLHVQVNNDEALKFYKKFNFEVIGKIENYYQRIQPRDGWILKKKINRKKNEEKTVQ
jgi:hypothetical protein